jgi:hypothetical protein
MDELISMIALLTVGGYETTAQLITNGTLLLLENPEQLALLRAQPALIPNAVEEMLRLQPSPSFNTRTVREVHASARGLLDARVARDRAARGTDPGRWGARDDRDGAARSRWSRGRRR